MKTIGLMGGMSWESSAEYYRIINEETHHRLGGVHSAKSLMLSPDFAVIEKLQHQGQWDELALMMQDMARKLEQAGAGCIVLCTNTMHRFAADIEKVISIPFLHIADPTAKAMKAQNITRVGLIGTAFTMEQDFYKGRLQNIYGFDVIIPNDEERKAIHRIIYDELVIGIVNEQSRTVYRNAIVSLIKKGAEAIILGCTEIMLLIGAEDSAVPVFDTTTLHAKAAVDLALGT